MSSAIGHSITALSIFALEKRQNRPSRSQWRWAAWLVIVAVAADIDHFVQAFHSSAHNGIRITHTIFGSLILPLFTITVLSAFRTHKRKLAVLGIQVTIAALSHLVLDMFE